MKKSQAARKVLKKLKEWDGSMPCIKMANEVIDLLVDAGMLPPFSKQRDFGCECGCKGYCPKGNSWDYEHMPVGANQDSRSY